MKFTSILVVTMLSIALSVRAASAAPASHPAATNPTWEQVAPGVWRAVVGKPEELTLFSAAGITPKVDALKQMPTAPFPLDQRQIEARQWDWKTALRFPLALDEDVYGLGVDFSNIRRTGTTFLLHVDHWGKVLGRTHAPVPLYVSTSGYAVFFNTARYLKMNVGHGVRLAAEQKPPVIDRTTGKGWAAQPRSDSVEAIANTQGMEVFVFAGPTPLDAMRRYNLYCGGGALPPKWGLGFLVRTPTRYSADDALTDIKQFRENGIPLDMLGLEPGWHDHAYPCSFEWDKTRFPDPAAFLKEVEKLHVRVNLWFNPYVAPSAPLYQKLLPFAGTHLVWNGIVPDFSVPEARKIFADHLAEEVVKVNPNAIGGFKIDEVDGYDRYLWPDTATFPSGRDGEQLRQTYGLLVQRTVYDLFKGANRRTMGQVRGTNGGASSFPFVIYSDSYDFNEYVTAVANSGFAGVLWSPEVRGGDAINMLRRTQAVVFSPLALYNGWASKEKLWTHADVKDHIKDAIVLRLRLLPYFYNTFAQYHHQGTPVIRPMQLVDGFKEPGSPQSGNVETTTANPYAIARRSETKDQYMFGDALLVAPIAPEAKSRKVVLPEGKWYDFFSGKFAGENETIEVTPSLAEIPIFVKDGSLVPMIEPRQWAPSADEKLVLEVRHYGEQPGKIALYDDDGETFAYEKGDYSWTKLEVEKDPDGGWQPRVTPDANGKPWRYADVKWTFMTK